MILIVIFIGIFGMCCPHFPSASSSSADASHGAPNERGLESSANDGVDCSDDDDDDDLDEYDEDDDMYEEAQRVAGQANVGAISNSGADGQRGKTRAAPDDAGMQLQR
jgi:hypothetical protein